MGFVSLGNPWQSNHIKITYVDFKEVFLAKEWNSFHLSRKKLDHLHLKDFLKLKCELYLKQPLTPPQHKIIDAYRTSNHRLYIETWWWMSIPIPSVTIPCHFGSYDAIENEAFLVLECPPYIPLEVSFHHYQECSSREHHVFVIIRPTC